MPGAGCPAPLNLHAESILLFFPLPFVNPTTKVTLIDGTLRGPPVHLTQFTDYGLRLAIFLGCHPERVASVDEVSRAFGISRHHLVKVVQTLTNVGVVETQRGRGGGVRLAMPPSAINVGWLIRQTEPHLNLVECFEPETNTCPLPPACRRSGSG